MKEEKHPPFEPVELEMYLTAALADEAATRLALKYLRGHTLSPTARVILSWMGYKGSESKLEARRFARRSLEKSKKIVRRRLGASINRNEWVLKRMFTDNEI